MKALDTDILVRFLTEDDADQAHQVKTLFHSAQEKGERFHVGQVVLLELLWVLESLYEYPRKEILMAVEKMLALPLLDFENPDTVEDLLSIATRSNCDLSDLLIGISARAHRCEYTLTFDRKASREKTLFQLLK